MPSKSKCKGCEQEAKTKKGWCSIECYRKNQKLVKNSGIFFQNQKFSLSHKQNIGKASQKWHIDNPEKSKYITDKMNSSESNLKNP